MTTVRCLLSSAFLNSMVFTSVDLVYRLLHGINNQHNGIKNLPMYQYSHISQILLGISR